MFVEVGFFESKHYVATQIYSSKYESQYDTYINYVGLPYDDMYLPTYVCGIILYNDMKAQFHVESQ